MFETYTVRVSATKWAKPSRYWIKMKTFGLSYAHGGEYVGVVRSVRAVEKIKRFCAHKKLRFVIDNEYGSRDTQYRNTFFSHTKPIRKKYYCAYCGKLMPAHEITVDHIYPVSKVSKSPALQRKLKRQGIKSINDIGNLVGACEACNKRKSAKMGKWIFLGRLGRKRWFWYLRMTVRAVLIAASLWVVVHGGYEAYLLAQSLSGKLIV